MTIEVVANKRLFTSVQSESRKLDRSTRIGSLVLVLILLALSTAALMGSYASYRAGAAVEIAAGLEQAFQKARYAVGAEESLERKYRLEPSPEVRARHHEAASSMIAALGAARLLGADVPLIDSVIASHTQYLSAIEHMFAAIDRMD